mmetsp:Transcript_15461/g.25872  ORF Transcript_15461/g.25872 Transcript_15461/m.25872 type:complete len:210 (+) Transcript_15461:264-893(+)
MRTRATPTPVTDTQPSPAITISPPDFRHPSPSISNSSLTNGPNSASRSGEAGGETRFPTCFCTNSSALPLSVGCSLTSLETKNVKKKGFPDTSSTFARPPISTHLPSLTRNVADFTGLTGMTSRSSAGVNLLVSWPLFNNPGVSIMVMPFGSLIFKKSNVVPGRFDTVAMGDLFLPDLLCLCFVILRSLAVSSSRLMKEDLPTFAAPMT